MQAKTFLFFATLLTSFVALPAKSAEVCRSDSQIPFMLASTVEDVLIAQKIAILATANDMTNFCKWNRMDRLAEGIDKESLRKYRDTKFLGDMGAAEKILAPKVREMNTP